MDLKQVLFFRAKAEEDAIAEMGEWYFESEKEYQRTRFAAVYQIIEEAGLKDEYAAWKNQEEVIMEKINLILEKFRKEYNFLYENHDNVAGYREALEWGDMFIGKFPATVAKIARARGDVFCSDREVAALAFALMDVIGDL